MKTAVDRLAEEAMKLPGESRAQLADLLVQSLDAGALSRLDELWISEAKRRRDEIRSGAIQPIPGDEARRRVRESLGG